MRISDWSSDVCSSDLAGDGPCQESLPCPRRTDQQHAFRCCPAKPGVFLRPLEEVADFHQLVLRLVDPSDVRKGALRLRFLVNASRLAFAEAAQPSAHPAALLRCPAEQPAINTDNHDRRPPNTHHTADKTCSPL